MLRWTTTVPLALLFACTPAARTTTPEPAGPDSAALRTPPGAADAAAATPAGRRITQRLDSLARAAFPATRPGAAVLVRRGEDVLLRQGYGLASLELNVPVRPEHVFRIGSITKQFTAVAILKLAEQGRLSLDDEITRFLPDWPTHGQRITIGALLSHTAGVASYTDLPQWRTLWRRDLPLDSLLALFRNEPLGFVPGEQWAYSNSGYILLGAIIERVSGRSCEEYVEQELLAPLGLERTRYGHNYELVPGLVAGYQPGAGGWVPAQYLSLTQPYAAGSLLSSIDDLDRWLGALAAGRIVADSLLLRAWTPVRLRSGLSTGYGLGWSLGQAFGERTIEHGGGIHGFSTYQLWIPESDVRVIVLANSQSPPRAPGTVALELARIALGDVALPAPLALDSAALQQYVGVYRMPDGTQREMLRRADTLLTRVDRGPTTALVPIARDEFMAPASQNRYRFERPTAGPVISLLVQPRIGPEMRGPRVAETLLEGLTLHQGGRAIKAPRLR